MIPNSAPMAAVYLAADKRLFSRPVVAWDAREEAMVSDIRGSLVPVDFVAEGNQFLGMWQHGWAPSQDEMASLLPEHTPGTPHPLATAVTVQQVPGGWAAWRTADKSKTVARAATLDGLRAKLDALGNYHVDQVATPDES